MDRGTLVGVAELSVALKRITESVRRCTSEIVKISRKSRRICTHKRRACPLRPSLFSRVSGALTIVVNDYLATTATRNTYANPIESDHRGSLPGTSGNYSGHSYGRADDGS